MNIQLPSKEERHLLFGSVPSGPKTKPTQKNKMKDLQNQENNFLFSLNQVGVSNVKIPVHIHSILASEQQTTIASFTLTSSIPYNYKGTNMSRFIEQLEQYRKQGFTLKLSMLHQFVQELSERLEQADATLEVQFPWFYERKGPVSGLTGLNHATAQMRVSYNQYNGFTSEVGLTCGITTLCPCSKEISEYSAHNQRGYVEMTVQLSEGYHEEIDWKEALLYAGESNASACIHPILKRTDEKMVTEQAFENPRFVEDMVRLVGADLYEIEWVTAFTVKCRNEESIHLHDAIASLTVSKI